MGLIHAKILENFAEQSKIFQKFKTQLNDNSRNAYRNLQ